MEISISTPSEFSFSETVCAHGWRRLLPFVWHEDEQTLERVERLPNGLVVTLSIRATAGALTVEVSDGDDVTEVPSLVRRMMQLDVPMDEFHRFCAAHPELCHIPFRKQGRMLRSPTLWEDCCKVIATSNTTWTQTIGMTARLVEHFGSPLPADPTRRAFPTPGQLASVPFDVFAAKARMGYRNAYVHAIATQIATGRLDLEAWQSAGLPAPELRKRLLTLPGIGPYGAACLMLYLGKPEHVNADSWARMLLSKELGHPVTDQQVRAFFESYGEWRGLVYNFFAWKSP